MTGKKFAFNLNDFTEWSEFNWIQFEIDNSLIGSWEWNVKTGDQICSIETLKNTNDIITAGGFPSNCVTICCNPPYYSNVYYAFISNEI